MTIQDLKPGQRVRIRQQIERREGNWRNEVVGVVEQVNMEPTGSWYATGVDDKLWLYRIRLRKENGEQTTISMDRFTEIESVISNPPLTDSSTH